VSRWLDEFLRASRRQVGAQRTPQSQHFVDQRLTLATSPVDRNDEDDKDYDDES
jgi:hypothetical protein